MARTCDLPVGYDNWCAPLITMVIMRDANTLKPIARSPCRKGEKKAKRKVESLSDLNSIADYKDAQ